MNPPPHIVALVVAAGNGSRVGGAVPKQYRCVAGKPLLRHSVEALLAHPAITAVQVVIHPDHAALYDAAMGQPHTKLLPPIMGGAERADSVRAGLACFSNGGITPAPPPLRGSPSATHAYRAPGYVLIHDAARPFLSHAMLDALLAKLAPGRAVVPALAVADTVRRYADGAWEEVPRDGLMRTQTPQGFWFASLVSILEGGIAPHASLPPSADAARHGRLREDTTPPTTLTDDAAIWLAAGLPLDYVQGAEELRKVTTAEDMEWAQQRAAQRVAIGSGYDVHALMPTANEEGVMRIGGIDIPSAHKLHGHSDADVVLHAVVDALLGALAEGDIGSHFPPSDAQWRGVDSALFVAEALRLVRARGGEITHLDITIVAERPKISPHREAMRAAIAAMLSLPITYVSVKATTTEKLGFTGREEGIAAHATATVRLPHA